MTFKQWIKKHKVTMRVTPIKERVESCEAWGPGTQHYRIRLERGAGCLIETEYSVGSGNIVQVLKKLQKEQKGRLYHSQELDGWLIRTGQVSSRTPGNILESLRILGNKHYVIDPAEVLQCLVLDASGAEEPFEDWAEGLGYDTDSRKAEAIWHSCRSTLNTLAQRLTLKQFNSLMECEE